MLRDFTPRLYQETIFATAALKNTLVVLPTGLGKTAVAAMLAAQRLAQYPKSKIIFLAPTKPLAEQHVGVFKRHLDLPDEKYVLFTGAVAPEKRVELWKNAQIVIGTPQGLENDLLGSRLDVTPVSLMIFDEAHHATGDYSYCFIAKHYQQKAQFPRILGLTASPGSDIEKIREVCKNLFIEAVEARTFEDKDVAAYVKPIRTEWVKVDLPDAFLEIQRHLLTCYQSKLKMMKSFGYLNTTRVVKRDLLELQRQLHAEIAQGNKEMALLRSISLLAEAVKVQHALELIETQGILPLAKYLRKLESEARIGQSKAVKNLVADVEFKAAFVKTMVMAEHGIQHPKLVKLAEIVKDELLSPEVKIIIFTQYRDSAVDIVGTVNTIAETEARLFVGQAKKGETGLTQKKQKEMLDAFRAHDFRVLVCTSVGEEGLDIPAVDLVLFYEPIPSAIRHIQRRGRTGRQEIGRVLIFMTNGTRDEAYRWVAHNKEKKMHRTLEAIKKEFVLSPQPMLSTFIPQEQKVQVVTDYREKGSDVMKALVDMGVSLQLEKLVAADYLCSADCAIEFKTVEDFVNSIIDGRLVEQLKALKQFQRPLVIVQGEQDMYSIRKIHPNAIRGMLATIAVGFGIPILQTRNAQDTASLIAIIAKREQDTARDFSLHARKPLTLAEQQEYLVSALPGLGLRTAQQLLRHFGSVEKMVVASIEQLKEVEGIGDVLAERIKNVVSAEYKKD